MKKTLLLLVGLCILAAPAVFAQSYSSTLPAFKLQFGDNFQYSDDYQAKFNQRAVLNGHRIQPGETYTISLKFKLSRDMEQEISACFVDQDAKVAYWGELTNYAALRDGAVLKANTEYTATFELKSVKAATNASGNSNTLIFATKGDGKPGSPGSGVKKAFVMDVLEFKLERK